MPFDVQLNPISLTLPTILLDFTAKWPGPLNILSERHLEFFMNWNVDWYKDLLNREEWFCGNFFVFHSGYFLILNSCYLLYVDNLIVIFSQVFHDPLWSCDFLHFLFYYFRMPPEDWRECIWFSWQFSTIRMSI